MMNIRLPHVLWILLAAFAMMLLHTTQATDEQEVIRQWSRNVVRLHTDRPVGYGLVIGWSQDTAWIAAPHHVVQGSQIHVEFPGYEHRVELCRPPLPRQRLADLTFLCAAIPDTHFFHTGLEPREYVPGENVVIVGGISGNVEARSRSGRLVNTPAAGVGETGGDLRVDKIGGRRGQSGAIVASPRGVVGIYLGSGGNVLSLYAIRQAKLQHDDIPWSLSTAEFFDSSIRRHVCVSADTSLRPRAVTLMSADRSSEILVGDCEEIPEGKYSVTPGHDDLSCEPLGLRVVGGEDAIRLHLTCKLQLAGSWVIDHPVGAVGSELTCSVESNGAFDCFGLSTLGLGYFEGRLTTSDDNVLTQNATLLTVQGKRFANLLLQWRDGTLAGTIQRESFSPVNLILRRR